VDCLLLSAWPIDEIFFLKARSHAAIHNYWLSLSVPAQCAALMPSAIIGPDGSESASVHAPEELAIATLDRDAPEFHIAVNLACPGAPKRTKGTSTGVATSTTLAATTAPSSRASSEARDDGGCSDDPSEDSGPTAGRPGRMR
jgi:hypothetical protein